MFPQIFQLLIDTITSIYLMIILLRFVLQLSKADFYNPVCQFIVKATNAPLIPLRRAIPSIAGLDTAALVLAYVFQLVMLSIKLLVLAGALPGIGILLAVTLVLVLGALLKLYFWSLLIMIIASWIAPASDNPALRLINQICEPIMAPFRKILPSMGGLDLSPILVFIVIQVLAIVLGGVSQQLGVHFALM